MHAENQTFISMSQSINYLYVTEHKHSGFFETFFNLAQWVESKRSNLIDGSVIQICAVRVFLNVKFLAFSGVGGEYG